MREAWRLFGGALHSMGGASCGVGGAMHGVGGVLTVGGASRGADGVPQVDKSSRRFTRFYDLVFLRLGKGKWRQAGPKFLWYAVGRERRIAEWRVCRAHGV